VSFRPPAPFKFKVLCADSFDASTAIFSDEEEVTLKQFKKYGTKRILHPLNPKYQDIELSDKKQYRIVGRIMEKTMRY
jgi:SOS-response transcriptional repressor LexA